MFSLKDGEGPDMEALSRRWKVLEILEGTTGSYFAVAVVLNFAT
jgi:hypothetical protein